MKRNKNGIYINIKKAYYDFRNMFEAKCVFVEYISKIKDMYDGFEIYLRIMRRL